MRLFILFFGIFIFFSAAPLNEANAEQKTLTENDVRDFVRKSSSLAAGYTDGGSKKDVERYLNKHLHPDARFKSTIKYVIPGYPEQTKVMTLEKEDYIKSIKESPNAVSNYDYDIDIESVRISSDGRKATLKTENAETGSMKISENQEVPIDGISRCNQIVMLNKKDVMQIFSAQCTTIVEFLDINN